MDTTPPASVPDVPDDNYWFRRHEAIYDHVASRVHGTVLDAGCGRGHGLAILRRAGARGVIGVDRDPITVAHARARYGHDGIPDVDVVEADLEDLPLVDDTLDGALCLQVVAHLAEPPEVLAELVRVVHPGGWVVVSTPNRLTSRSGPDRRRGPVHVHDFSADEVVELVADAGTQVEEVHGLHHVPDLARRLHGLGDVDPTDLPADPSRWDDDVRALVRGVTAADFRVAADGDLPAAASLDLVVWARVPG